MSDNVSGVAQVQATGLQDPDKPTHPFTIISEDTEAEGLNIEALAYDIQFKLVEQDLQTLTSDLLKAVPEKLYEHPVFKHMVQQLKQTLVCPRPRKRQVNIIGKSGAGKSSLLNCLLGLHGLAKVDVTAGCTARQTSYEGPFDGQSLDFAFKIQFFSINAIRQTLETLWHNWSTYDFEIKGDKDLTVDEKADAKQAAQTAFDVLRSLFCREEEFLTENKAKATLRSLKGKKVDEIVEPWLEWCRDILPDKYVPATDKQDSNDRSPVLKFQVNTQDELKTRLDPYAFPDPEYKRPSYWPLVDKIRIGLRKVPIVEFATFVDWPGVGDTNDMRGKATTGRVADCDEVWVVCDGNRIETEPELWRSVGRYSEDLPVSIICTKVDVGCDMDADMEKIKKAGFDIHALEEHDGEHSELTRKVENAQQVVDREKIIISDGYEPAPDNKRRKVSEEERKECKTRKWDLLELKEQLVDKEQERRKLIVDIRNTYLRSRIRAKLLQENLASYSVGIFFASSQHYLARKGKEKVAGPLLPLADTGIPALRAHILRQASPDIVARVKQNIQGETYRVLEGVGIAASPQDLADCHDVLDHIKKKHRRGAQLHQIYTSAIEVQSEDHFAQPVEDKVRELVKSAVSVVKQKRTWHASQLRGFVSKDGDHQTPKRPAHSWDSQFFGKLGDIIKAKWVSYETEESDLVKTMRDKLEAELNDIIRVDDRRGALRRVADKKGQFQIFLDTQIQRLKNECVNATEQYTATMKSVKVDATKPGCRTSKGYFNSAMEHVYAEGRAIKGKGYVVNINNHFEAELKRTTRSSPFISAAYYCKDAAEAAAEKQAQTIQEAFEECLTDICGWLTGIFVKHEDLKSIIETINKLEAAHRLGKERLLAIEARLAEVEKQYEAKEIEAKRLEKNRKERERVAKKARLAGMAET